MNRRPRSLLGLTLAATRIVLARLAPEARALLAGLAVVAVALLGAWVLRTCATPTRIETRRLDVHPRVQRPALLVRARRDAMSGLAVNPSLVASSGRIGLAWLDLRSSEPNVYFVRLAQDGARLGKELRVTDGGSHVLEHLASAGREYLLTWTELLEGDSAMVKLARVSAEGNLVGTPRTLSRDDVVAFASRLECSPRDCLAAWYEMAGTKLVLHTMPLTLGGQPRDDEARISLEGVPLGPLGLACNGQGYGVAWSENATEAESSRTLFAALDAHGRPSASVPVASSDHYAGGATLAARADNTFALVWESPLNEQGDARLTYAAVSSRGVETQARPIAEAPSARSPSAVASGSETALAWSDLRNGRYAVAFARFARDGRATTPVVPLADGSQFAIGPALALDGRDVLAAWTENTDRGIGILLVRVGTDGRPRGAPVQVATVGMHAR